MAKKKWIQGAIKNKGALTRAAKKSRGIKKGGGIKASWLNKQIKKGGKMGKRASLAKTLRKMHK